MRIQDPGEDEEAQRRAIDALAYCCIVGLIALAVWWLA